MGKSSNFANIHNYDNNEYFFRGRNHGTDDENSQPNHKNGGRRFTSDNAYTYRKSKAPRDARGFAVRRHTSRPWQSWHPGTHTENQSTGRRPENRKRSRKETARNDTAASGGAVPAPQRGRVAGCQIKIAWWNTDAERRGDIPCFPVGRYHGKQHGCDRPTDRPTGRF